MFRVITIYLTIKKKLRSENLCSMSQIQPKTNNNTKVIQRKLDNPLIINLNLNKSLTQSRKVCIDLQKLRTPLL